jgi:streptogramin lyase
MRKSLFLIIALISISIDLSAGTSTLLIKAPAYLLTAESAALHTSINAPRDLAYDPSGFLYISEVGDGRIVRLDIARGTVAMINTPPGYSGPGNEILIAMDTSRGLLMASLRGEISKLDIPSGLATSLTSSNSGYTVVTSIASDHSGGTLGTSLNQLVRWTPDGRPEVIAGTVRRGFTGDGGPSVEASFSGLMGVAVNATGDIFVADFNNCRIRKIDSQTRLVSTVAGSGDCRSQGDDGPAKNADLSYPSAITCDKEGNLFFVEESFRIRRIDKHGIISTYAGTGERGFSGDGGIATNARFEHPSGLAVDGKGNLYIADYLSNRIRRVDAVTRVITTVAGDGSPKRNEVTL